MIPVFFAATSALIKRSISDPLPERPLVQEVYGSGPITPMLSRKVEVLVARLRSGHSMILAAHRARFGLGDSPTCPHCNFNDEDLTHWFSQCPASLALRVRCFGSAYPPLSALLAGDGAVASYLRGLRLL